MRLDGDKLKVQSFMLNVLSYKALCIHLHNKKPPNGLRLMAFAWCGSAAIA